jgi:biotin carboxylase
MDNRGKRIFILGAGVMQLPAIRAAKDLGLEVIAADGSSQAPGRERSDVFAHIDLKDREALLDFARREKEERGLHAVFTAGTDFSAAVAYLAAELGLPGIPLEAALNASIKSRMREAFRKHSVPSPNFVVTGDAQAASALLRGLSYPLVVKPVDSMGARGCMRVDSGEELEAAVSDSVFHSRSGQAIIEEYVEGPEFSIDALVWRGKITVCGLADRHIFFPPYFVEMGHTMPSEHSPDELAEVLRVFELGVRALGIDNGAAKGDIKLGKDGKGRVGEIAARLSGGYMSGWTFPYSSGVDLTRAAILMALGSDPGDLLPRKADTAAERAWISIPGRVKRVEGLDRVRAMPGVREVFPRSKPGDDVVFPRNNVEKCGNVIAVSSDRDEAVRQARTAAANVLLFLESGNRETRDFLAGRGLSYPPDAFPRVEPELEAELERMPAESSLKPYAGGKPVILPLKGLSRHAGSDWQGRKAEEALDIVLRECQATIGAENAHFGSGFWKAFLRGSYQGGCYWIEDSLKKEDPSR